VPTTADTIDEVNETYTLTVGAASGTGTITDDDATPSLSINDLVINEAAGTATFTATLSAASGQTVTVGYNTSNGSATAGADYTAIVGGTLTFLPGVTTQTITVSIANDTTYEGPETFNVNLITPTNATISDNLGLGTIRDDGTGIGGTDDDRNAAPQGTNATLTTLEDTNLVLTTANFGFSDPNNTPANTLNRIAISSLPTAGTLLLNGVAVSAGQFINATDVTAGLLVFRPASNAPSGAATGAGYASFTFQVEDNGGTAGGGVNLDPTPNTLTINVTPVADTPTLTVFNNSAEVFRTGWESAPNGSTTSDSVAGPTFEGWTLLTVNSWNGTDAFPGGTNGFEIWNATTDTMADSGATQRSFVMAPGNGNQTIELNNPTSAIAQTLGIERSVATITGQVYSLSFDYAGRLGYTTDYTRIRVTVDGVQVQFSDTSPQTSLDWRTLSFSFTGNGAAKIVRIETDPIQAAGGGRGAMTDDIALTHFEGAIAGNAVGGTKTDIGLDRYIDAALVDADGSEALTLTMNHLPTGAQIIVGGSTILTPVAGIVTFNGSDLGTATLRLDAAYLGNLQLDVTARATESSNGSTAVTGSQTLNLAVLPSTGASIDPSVNLMGGINNDTLQGDAGSQTLYGGRGADTVMGEAGADTFRWALGDQGAPGGPALDTIADFSAPTFASGGDRLDLRDLLQGETGVSNLQNYLDFSVSGGTAVLRISSSGGFTGGTYAAGAEDQRITFTGIANMGTALGLGAGATDAQIIQDLITKGKLITD
jgi:hypothetical protein